MKNITKALLFIVLLSGIIFSEANAGGILPTPYITIAAYEKGVLIESVILSKPTTVPQIHPDKSTDISTDKFFASAAKELKQEIIDTHKLHEGDT